MRLRVCLYVSNDTGTNGEEGQVKDMGKGQFLEVLSAGSDSEVKPVRPGTCLPPAAHPKSLFVAVIGILHRLSPRALAGDSHRGLLCNLSLAFSLKHTHTPFLSIALVLSRNCQMRRMAKHIIDRGGP